MRENYEKALEMVFKHEGGYVNHKSDPGGCTNYGITIKTLRAFRGSKDVDCEDVKNLSRDEAMLIYRQNYWDKVKGDELPAGFDVAVFDFAVNAGIKRAIKTLQEVVKVDTDGIIGPKTLAAVNEKGNILLLLAYHALRLAFYRKLKIYPVFKNGWERRVSTTFAVSKRLIVG
jgi:lysozyme family protein